MPNKGKLILIPSAIAASSVDVYLPSGVKDAITHLRYFLVENIRTARRYLSSLSIYASIEELRFEVLDKNTNATALESLCAPLLQGHDVGVLSESGCPGVADPGALAVAYAHKHNVRVMPLVGPSSLLLALMASGLNGQHFAFHGYLPIHKAEVARVLPVLEKESRSRSQTQIFIETPYRNNGLCKSLLKHLSHETRLCIAVDITGTGESIHTRTVADWRKSPPVLPKLPAVFLFLA